MFLSNSSVRRPVAMASLIIGLTLLGMNAYRKVGLEFMPKVDIPYITVVTIYPGASPSEIETDVAKRVEDAVVSIDGLKHVTSTCMEDHAQTLLEFNLDVDVDTAANDVREKLDLILSDFPEGVEKPKVLKYDINAKPIINLALKGSVPLDELYDYADNTLSDRLSVLSGVAEVQLIGGAEREVHLLLDRQKLAERGLTSADVVQAVAQNVRTIPSGRVREDGTEYAVKFDAEYKSIEAIDALEIAYKNESRVYLRDVGKAMLASAELRQAALIDGESCIGMRVVKKADANAVQVVDRVKSAMGRIQTELPGGMELVWISDDGDFIESSVDSAVSSIWQGVLLTAAILFLFLYNIRATLIVAITMPLTVIIGLFFIQGFGYTLNTSTLLSFGLSVGILVTNSIIVLEAVSKRFAEGMTAKEAARVGSGEAAVAVLASAGTNVVVLFPIITMGSLVGRFFAPFALTMVVVTLVSLFISFTLTPILCAVMLKRSQRKGILTRIEGVFNGILERITNIYTGFLRFFARHRLAAAAVLLVTVAAFVHSMFVASTLGMSFVPNSDVGEILVKLEYPTKYDLKQTVSRVNDVEIALKDMPGLNHVFTNVGKVEGVVGKSSEGVYLAQVLLKFCSKTERQETLEMLLNETRSRLVNISDCIVTANAADMIGGQSSAIELEIAGDDFEKLDGLALATQKHARTIPGILDPDTSVREGKPELRIRPNRAVLSELGVPAVNLGLALRGNLEGIKAGVYKAGDRSYDIRVKFAEEEGKEQVASFQFPGMPGSALLLTNFADVQQGISPIQITRNDKRRISKVYANLAEKKPLSTAVAELNQVFEKEAELPTGYSYGYRGEFERMQESGEAFLEAGLIAILLTYLTLAAIL
ncbi:MAG: efflux RND transporter permease subunit, partial [Candidatus Hydrogenedentales bacterium]